MKFNSIDDVTALVMEFLQQKVNGSDADIGLRSAIVRLAKGSTKEGRAALDRLGMPLTDYTRGKQPVTVGGILSGLMAGGIGASLLKAAAAYGISVTVGDKVTAEAVMPGFMPGIHAFPR